MQRRTSADHMFDSSISFICRGCTIRLFICLEIALRPRMRLAGLLPRRFWSFMWLMSEFSASRRHASSLRFACGTHSSHMVQTKLCLYKARVRWSFYKTCRSLIFKSARQLYSPVCMGVPCGNWRISSACRSGLSLPGWKARSANYAACGHTLSSPADKMRNILHIISEKFF